MFTEILLCLQAIYLRQEKVKSFDSMSLAQDYLKFVETPSSNEHGFDGLLHNPKARASLVGPMLALSADH